MKQIDISKPRRMYWDYDAAISNGCPECKMKLVNEHRTFLLAIDVKDKIEPFNIGSDAGHFCPVCPVIVIDSEKLKHLAAIGARVDEPEFAAVGLIDLDAVPEDKRHLPMGEDGNPIPVVKFLYHDVNTVRSKKIGRNEPCPCGSGKKYKKCCM